MRLNLVNERKQATLTQLELAKKISVSTRHYKSLEAGTSNGSVEVWEKLSEMFGKTINYLLEKRVNLG